MNNMHNVPLKKTFDKGFFKRNIACYDRCIVRPCRYSYHCAHQQNLWFTPMHPGGCCSGWKALQETTPS